jgi:hypothetical protein
MPTGAAGVAAANDTALSALSASASSGLNIFCLGNSVNKNTSLEFIGFSGCEFKDLRWLDLQLQGKISVFGLHLDAMMLTLETHGINNAYHGYL